MLAMFVSLLDQTIVSIACPPSWANPGGVDHMPWVTTAYVLASTCMMPVYGKLGDLFAQAVHRVGAVHWDRHLRHRGMFSLIASAVQGLEAAGS